MAGSAREIRCSLPLVAVARDIRKRRGSNTGAPPGALGGEKLIERQDRCVAIDACQLGGCSGWNTCHKLPDQISLKSGRKTDFVSWLIKLTQLALDRYRTTIVDRDFRSM